MTAILRGVWGSAVLVWCLGASAQEASDMPDVSNSAITEAPVEAPAPVKPKSKKGAPKVQAAQDRSGAFLPDWGAPRFGLSASPVVGFRYEYNPDTKASATQMEIGLGLGLQGIPLYAGNPGLFLEPYAGYAIGRTFLSPNFGDVRTGTYHRPWGGVRVPLLLRFYKHTLDVSYAQIKGSLVDTRKTLGVQSDNAFLIFPFFSAHYTFSYEKSAAETMSDVLAETYDQWYHARLFTRFLGAFLDMGPGVTFRKTYSQQEDLGNSLVLVEGNSTTTYAKAIAGADIIPNILGAEIRAKYVLSSKVDGTVTYDAARSPAEDLGAAASKLGVPDDYLYASAFVGLKRIFGNMGIGWRYNVDVVNAMERNGVRSTQTSQGLGVHYSVRM
jgi:hypothetical protein